MSRIRTPARVIACALTVLLLVSGCGASNNSQKGGDKGSITFGMFNFDELIAITNLWSVILKDKGYDVDIKTGDKGPVITGMSDGDYDSVLSLWTDADKQYINRLGKNITKLGTWNDEAKLTVAVNADAPIDSLNQLADNAKTFDNKIIGIESGASITQIVQNKVIPQYGLKQMDFRTSSTPAMLAELGKALKKDDPIAVTLWRPHWAYGAYKLKDLKDPKGALGKADSMNAYSSKKFKSENPKVAKWLGDFKMDTDMLNGLENLLFNEHKTKNYEPLIRDWIKDHKKYVDSLTD